MEAQKIAELTIKFLKALQKKDARHSTLERWNRGKLCEWLHTIDQNDHYTIKMINRMSKYQIIKLILEEEGYGATINDYSNPLEDLGVNTTMLTQISGFGV